MEYIAEKMGNPMVSMTVATLISIAIAAIFNWFSGRSLRKTEAKLSTQAEQLRKASQQIMLALESGGIVSWNRSADGEIIGRIIDLKVETIIDIESDASGSAG